MDKQAKKLSVLLQLKTAQSTLSLPELVELTENTIPERTLRRWLVSWVDDGIIERTGQKRGTKYQLVPTSLVYGQKENTSGHSFFLNSVREPSNDEKQLFSKIQSENNNGDIDNSEKYEKHTPPLFDGFQQNNFLSDVPKHRREPLLEQLRDLWTHNSTALEGNTLTLGDTHAVLGMGLTVSGKPLREHQEILGHAKAIDLLYQCIYQPASKSSTTLINKTFICDLHRAVQTDIVNDIFKPIGDWKIEINGTYTVGKDSRQRYIEYAHPMHVDSLMTLLIDYINALDIRTINLENAAEHYAKIHMAFVHIHPFWDGNGRLARLIANIVLLKAGLPPLVIDKDNRREYIECLAEYQIQMGQLTAESANPNPELWSDLKALEPFTIFCEDAYKITKTLIDEAKA